MRVRGVDVIDEPRWTRGVEPWVTYTSRPLQPPEPFPRTPSEERRVRQADVRLRRALRDAWCDPSRARRDLNVAGGHYKALHDAQGLANTFIAHAQTRLADANLAELSDQQSLPAANMAREEYAHGHRVFAALLQRAPAHYSYPRQSAVHRACTGQFMRPVPLRLDPEDARAAEVGA